MSELLLDSSPAKRARGSEDIVVLAGFAEPLARELLEDIERVAAVAPFRNMVVPGGHSMSVAMTNCGRLGWVTDRSGYRYTEHDPLSGRAWTAMPPVFGALAERAAAAAGFGGFAPDACLVNRYAPGARMGLHQDRNEADFGQPIVSVSLGLPATFLWGGAQRRDPVRRLPLRHGDVVVWGGAGRLRFHGVAPLGRQAPLFGGTAPGMHPTTGGFRFNLTFRRAG